MHRAVFFGSGGFAIPVLEALLRAPEVTVIAAVTAPARPAGRRGDLVGTPVAARAAALGIPVLTPERLRAPAALEALGALEPDIGVLSDYGKILPQEVLDLPAHGILNLHPSLLPRHRGATPIPAAILAGDPETGVSLFRMDAGMDTGPLVAQARTPLRPDEDAPALEARLAVLAGDLLLRSLSGWLDGSMPAHPQAAQGVTVTRPLHREDGRLDPGLPARQLARAVRAHRPWPGSFLETPEGRLVVTEATAVNGPGGGEAAGSADAPSVGERGDSVDAPAGNERGDRADSSVGERGDSVDAPAGNERGDRADSSVGARRDRGDSAPSAAPGEIVRAGEFPALVTVDGLLIVRTVRPAGGREMPGDAFVRGRPRFIGSRVG